MMRHYSNTSVETELSSPIGPSDTQLQIDDTSGLPTSFPFSLILDFGEATVEVVTVTGLSGPNFVVNRAQDGTGAQSHSAGAVVVHGVTARDLAEPQAHIEGEANVHGVGAGAALVGTTTTQVLTNKTIEDYSQVRLWDGLAYNLLTAPTVYVGSEEPATPADGDIWLETE